MATELTSALPTIHPVLDPLIISLADPGAPASGRTEQSQVELQLEVEDVLNSDQWQLIGEYLNPYDYTTDTAKVSLHKELQGALQHFIPNLSVSGSQAMSGVVKRYRISARDVVDGEAQGSFNTSSPGLAWLAGNQYTQIGTDLTSGKAYLFLTTRSTTRRLHPSERIHLQVLPITSGTPTVRIQAFFTDGTDQTDTVALSAATALVPFAVNITLPSYSKTVSTIDIDITGLSGTAQKLTYKLIAKPGPYLTQLFYANSLGGLEPIAFTGKAEELNDPTSEIFQAQEYPPTSGQEGNHTAFNQRAVDSFVLRSGYLSKAETRSLRDMTLRNQVFLLQDGELLKLILNPATARITKQGEFLHSLQISARFAYDQLAYTS